MEQGQELQRGTSALVVAQTIRNDIQAGRLKHGQQLPSTRTLAGQWGTSVATISRAMGILAEEGLVLNRARSSRLVNNPPKLDVSQQEREVQPQVILIGGYTGSGKTELGRILARRAKWAILNKDTMTRALVEAALEGSGESPHERDSKLYHSLVRPAEYEVLLSAMEENVACGNSVIITAPFIREFADQAWCDRVSANVESWEARLHLIWVRCDADSMKAYIRRRGAARDAAKLADWDAYMRKVDLQYTPRMTHHILDNSVGARPLQQQAADFLTKMVTS